MRTRCHRAGTPQTPWRRSEPAPEARCADALKNSQEQNIHDCVTCCGASRTHALTRPAPGDHAPGHCRHAATGVDGQCDRQRRTLGHGGDHGRRGLPRRRPRQLCPPRRWHHCAQGQPGPLPRLEARLRRDQHHHVLRGEMPGQLRLQGVCGRRSDRGPECAVPPGAHQLLAREEAGDHNRLQAGDKRHEPLRPAAERTT